MIFILMLFFSLCLGDEANRQVLDFEAEVIEGEKRRPDLFLQLGTQDQNFESILYGRSDFNAYHKAEKKWRPGYYEPKRKKAEPAK